MATNNQRITAYLPQELSDRLAQYKSEQGFKGDSEAILTILNAFFEVSHQSVTPKGISITPQTGSDVLSVIPEKLKDLEERIEALEVLNKKSFEQVSYSIKSITPSITSQTGSDVLSVTPETRADGLHWLTSKQAYAVAVEQGCDRNFNGFRSWAKRNPEQCLALYGLRGTSYSGKSNTTASFERSP